MAANTELQFLWKIVETQDFHTVDKLKVTEDFLLEAQNQEVFRYIYNHYHNQFTYGSVPSGQIIVANFPRLPYVTSTDSLATLAQQLRASKMRSQIITLANNLMVEADVDPWKAVNSLREATANISSQHEISEDLLLSNAYQQLLTDYQLVASGSGLTGIPWPWSILNEDTQGLHGGDFIVIYGRPKSMKTFVGLYIGVNAYWNANARVLVFSMEMKPIRVLKRAAALLAQVDYEKLNSGKLNEADYYNFFMTLQQLERDDLAAKTTEGHVPAFMVTGRGKGDRSVGGVNSLQAKIREFQPDLVIVDGMYLMRDDRGQVRTIDWKSIAHISQDLKSTADMFNIPVIGITQANRGASKNAKDSDVAEIAYADAIGQDCDMAIRVQKREDPQTNENEIILGFPGTREGKLEAFVIHGIPATNFTFKSKVVTPTPDGGSGSGPPQQRSVPQLPTYRK